MILYEVTKTMPLSKLCVVLHKNLSRKVAEHCASLLDTNEDNVQEVDHWIGKPKDRSEYPIVDFREMKDE